MRRSPLHALHSRRCTEWVTVNGMPMPARYERSGSADRVVLADVSCGLRTGLKGAGAAAWLDAQRIAVPGRHNSWVAAGCGSLVARLGETEFFLEDGHAQGPATSVAQALIGGAPADVYPVLRQDVSLLLCGDHAGRVLLETCSLDSRELRHPQGDLALSSMVGVSVLLVPVAERPSAYRLWADPSFGPYLWETLLEIVESHGGGAAGWTELGAFSPM